MRNRIIASAVILAASVGMAHANMVANGDFETMPGWGTGILGDSGYMALTGTMLPGWTIEPNHAVTIHNTVLYPYISGSYSVNTDGEGWNGHNVDMFQDITAIQGQTYKLEFDWKNWYSGNPLLDISITETGSNSVLAHGSYGISAGLHHETFTFVSTGSNLRLRVKHAPESGYNDNTFIVDNFSLTAVPEPSSMLAMAVGAVALFRKRRR